MQARHSLSHSEIWSESATELVPMSTGWRSQPDSSMSEKSMRFLPLREK